MSGRGILVRLRDPIAQTRVSLEFVDDRYVATFVCAFCDEMMETARDRRWWVCPACGIELSLPEADEVLRVAKKAIRQGQQDVSAKRGRWHWVPFFGKRVAAGR